MSTDEATAPRRLRAQDVIAAQQALLDKMATRTPRESDKPSFGVKRVTTSGALGEYELRVDVPVCDEFPTSAEALAFTVESMETLAKRFPMHVQAKP